MPEQTVTTEDIAFGSFNHLDRSATPIQDAEPGDSAGVCITQVNDSNIHRVEYHPEFSIYDPIMECRVMGSIDIEYWPYQSLLNVTSFDRWLRTHMEDANTADYFLKTVFMRIWEAIDPVELRVAMHAAPVGHGGLSLEIWGEHLPRTQE
jgi:NADPH-dependent 7-cyano-7-deazaguanine reductase QueF